MASWASREGFSQGFHPRFNLGAMTASVAAHAVVVALLVMTWREDVLVEGGTRSALVAITLSTQEGGPGPKTPSPLEAIEPTPEPTPPPAVQAAERPSPQQPRPLPEPVPSPAPREETLRAERNGGGGEGRTGRGVAASTTRPMPVATLVPVRAIATPAASANLAIASVPPRRSQGQGQERGGEVNGTGATGGGNSGTNGNATTSNYSGRVYKHLQRYKHVNTVGSGKAVIALTVEPGGAARDVVIARSSGSSRFDREALQMVRRAQPLPSPPDGKPHRFNFEISGD